MSFANERKAQIEAVKRGRKYNVTYFDQDDHNGPIVYMHTVAFKKFCEDNPQIDVSNLKDFYNLTDMSPLGIKWKIS